MPKLLLKPSFKKISWQKISWLVLGAGVLLLVLSAYANPDFIVTTANQIWFCFS